MTDDDEPAHVSPRLDLEVLLGHLAGFARAALESRGSLTCLGAYLAPRGGITNVVVEPPEDGSGAAHMEFDPARPRGRLTTRPRRPSRPTCPWTPPPGRA